MRIIFPLILLLGCIIAARAFQNFRKRGNWRRVEHPRLHSALHLDNSKRAMRQFLKIVENNVGSKAKYLTDKNKDQFLEAALKFSKNNQKAQRDILNYAIREYSSSSVSNAVVKALLIAVPLSLASGVVLHSWWTYFTDRYEIVWQGSEEEQQQEVSSLNPRLLPMSSVAPATVKATVDGNDAREGLTDKKWFNRLSSWFSKNSGSEANNSADSTHTAESDAAASASSPAAPPRRTYSDDEYKEEVAQLSLRVDTTLKESDLFSEVERFNIISRLWVILNREVEESERDLALIRYSSVSLYPLYWREFHDREIVATFDGSSGSGSSVGKDGIVSSTESHTGVTAAAVEEVDGEAHKFLESSGDSTYDYMHSDSLSPSDNV